MSESLEKSFAQKEEGKEKSPEEIKEEKALLLAEEIKKIKERMKKEGETVEGYQRIIELGQEIEELYEEKERNYEAEVKTIVANLEQALEKGANKDIVVQALAGVGTKESMALRERLLKEALELEDASIEVLAELTIAIGLAGVNTEEAEEFRKKHFADDPNLFASSYITSCVFHDAVVCRYGYVV